MIKIFLSVITINIFLCLNMQAQKKETPFAANTTKDARTKEYRSLINNSINKNVKLSFADSTEDYWQEAFGAMLLLNYRTAFIDARIRSAMDSVEYRSTAFQKNILQLIYALYPKAFEPQVLSLVKKVNDPKLFAMCSEYLFLNNPVEVYKPVLQKRMKEMEGEANAAFPLQNPFFIVINNKLLRTGLSKPPLDALLSNTFLPGEMVVYSFQRKNRNYPGLAMVRGKDGSFINNPDGRYFSVAQLARSSSNMPGYISNGNTPQGIFKVFGFDNSKSIFIGPTTNLQMVLPFERSNDVSDSVTQTLGDNYRFYLPASWKNYFPFYEAYYAGKAGRTEIIAHGTTVNPEYYKNKTYYPLTPTEGCLCTKEIWSTQDGKRKQSDQQKLVDAVQKAGGANGYLIVVEIDEQERPVSLKDILPFIK